MAVRRVRVASLDNAGVEQAKKPKRERELERKRCNVQRERGRYAGGGKPKVSKSLKRIGWWPRRNFFRASFERNQPARSISGKRALLPDLGGHSISKRLLTSFAGSQSPSTAQAWTILPPGCLKAPNALNSPCGLKPVSSWNSRRAAASRSSPASAIPLGIDHAPSSF